MRFARLEYDYSINYNTGGNLEEGNGIITSSFYPAVFNVGFQIITGEQVFENEKSFAPSFINFGELTTQLVEITDLLSNNVIYNNQSGTPPTTLPTGTYQIFYSIRSRSVATGANQSSSYLLKYIISVVRNRLPLKKWTITDVINRCCETVEPLIFGEKARFRLDGVNYDNNGDIVWYDAEHKYRPNSQAEQLDKVLSPEFTFTKMHLREMLKQVGGRIHGEPRTISSEYLNGKHYFTFKYDFYGENTETKISKRKYVSCSLSQDINEYCTGLDSSVDNLVNTLNYAQGVALEPFNGGYRALRSESTTVRLTDTNSFIKTDLPIRQIKKIWCRYIKDSVGVVRYDITPYLFESADYKNLSSYKGTYPYCKAYALEYTIGQPNITGLFFINPNAISSIFEDFAIENIIEAVSGEDFSWSDADYIELSFEIEYIPFYSARIKTNKATIIPSIPRELAYNQGANVIESRYYGENLKGVVARLGNISKTYTYHLAYLSDIPKVGNVFREIGNGTVEDFWVTEEYYISSVAVEILPTYIRCTVGLSKDFNRLSEYVGINSEKRMYEISEKMSVERESVLREYLTVNFTSYSPYIPNNGFLKNDKLISLFFGSGDENTEYLVSAVQVKGKAKDKTPVNSNYICLPVLSSAYGNTLAFSFKFEDNYNAGQSISFETGANGVSGYWGNYVSYTDYYGKLYWLDFSLYNGSFNPTAENPSRQLPNYQIPTNSGLYPIVNVSNWRYRKDNGETPFISYELVAVSTNPNVVIGSALCENCKLVNANPITDCKLYVFPFAINGLRQPDLSQGLEIPFDIDSSIVVDSDNIEKGIKLPNTNIEHLSFALMTPITEKTIEVEDDDGFEITQTIYEGGEILVGYNGKLTGQYLSLNLKRSVYE